MCKCNQHRPINVYYFTSTRGNDEGEFHSETDDANNKTNDETPECTLQRKIIQSHIMHHIKIAYIYDSVQVPRFTDIIQHEL